MDRDTAVQENVRRLKELQAAYPARMRMLRSSQDVDVLNIERIMDSSRSQTLDNADPTIPDFVASALSGGKQVVILPAGRTGLMIFAGHGLF